MASVLDITTMNIFFISCQKGNEPLLEQEVMNLTNKKPTTGIGGVELNCSDNEILDVILNSRVASRALKLIKVFDISNEKDIYALAKQTNWDLYLTTEMTFKVETIFDSVAKTQFKNSVYISQLIKDSIVDSFKELYSIRPNINLTNPDVLFQVRLAGKHDKFSCTISIDLTGSPMSNRGYRTKFAEAPLRENLAAAIILNTLWDPTKDHLIDPMCGSGTILIEAALIKYNIAPSYLHAINAVNANNFNYWSMSKQPWFKANNLIEILKEKLSLIQKSFIENVKNSNSETLIEGFDNDEKVLKIANESISLAKLENLISISSGDCRTVTPIPDEPCVIITNPPYGERLGQESDLRILYYEFGENIKKNFKGHKVYIFTGNPDLRKKISLQTSKRIPMYNGGIECRLLEYKLW